MPIFIMIIKCFHLNADINITMYNEIALTKQSQCSLLSSCYLAAFQMQKYAFNLLRGLYCMSQHKKQASYAIKISYLVTTCCMS